MPIVEASWQVLYSPELRARRSEELPRPLPPPLDIAFCLMVEVLHLTVPLPCRCKQHYNAIHGRTSHLVESSLFLRWLHHTGRCRFTAGHLPVYICLGVLDGFTGLLPCGWSMIRDLHYLLVFIYTYLVPSAFLSFGVVLDVMLVAGPVRRPCRMCVR